MVRFNLTSCVYDADDILWRTNPFYSRPAFPAVVGTSVFGRLCDNAMNSLGEMCAQIAVNSGASILATSEDDEFVSFLKQVFLDLNHELENARDDDCIDDGENYRSAADSNCEKNIDYVGEFDLDWTERSRCHERACHRSQFVLQMCEKTSSEFVPSFLKKNLPVNDNSLDGLYSVAIAIALEFDHYCLDQSQSDLEAFYSEFNILNQELDNLMGLDMNGVKICNQSQGFKSNQTLNKNNKETVIICGGDLGITTCEKFKCKFNRLAGIISASSYMLEEGLSCTENSLHAHQDGCLNKTEPISYACNNMYTKNAFKNHSTMTDCSDFDQVMTSLYVTSEALVLEDDYEGAHVKMITEEPFMGGRVKDSKLSVVFEENEDLSGTASESSDIVAWRQDLWCSGLYDSDEDCHWIPCSKHSQQKWFSSNDGEGRVYFFEENSNQSSWTLPKLDLKENRLSLEQKTPPNNEPVLMFDPVSGKNFSRSSKSKSIFSGNESSSISSSATSHNWPQLLEGHMAILKEGPLNKTKITENGKRLRKNWTTTHAVLTELLLLFFKDNKGYPAMLSGSGRPELSVDLNGAVIDAGDKVSSRHNVYLLSTVLGLQVLIQSDCAATAADWLLKIQTAIDNLPSSSIKAPRVKAETPPEEAKSSRLSRTKSMKSKQKSVSIEDLSNSNVAERQTKIKERLKKFFHRRPSVEILVKKGIFKDEPVFGCVLEQICPVDMCRVPRLVLECILCIERSEENMKTDGLYRVSGNLSQVQKIRCKVDQHEYGLLDLEEDVHVLTGTLKLFFRELKQPIIPFKFFNKALTASTNQNRSEKIKHFRDIVKSLPPCNYDTLKCLLQHLLRVTQFKEFNRMHIPNIAIVFGPTLMWSEQESQNMACDLMQQNLVIECLLSDFSLVF